MCKINLMIFAVFFITIYIYIFSTAKHKKQNKNKTKKHKWGIKNMEKHSREKIRIIYLIAKIINEKINNAVS